MSWALASSYLSRCLTRAILLRSAGHGHIGWQRRHADEQGGGRGCELHALGQFAVEQPIAIRFAIVYAIALRFHFDGWNGGL